MWVHKWLLLGGGIVIGVVGLWAYNTYYVKKPASA